MFTNTDLYPTLAEQARDEAVKKAVQEVMDRPIKKRARQDAEYAEFCKRNEGRYKPKRRSRQL